MSPDELEDKLDWSERVHEIEVEVGDDCTVDDEREAA